MAACMHRRPRNRRTGTVHPSGPRSADKGRRNGTDYRFSESAGYIEGDRGRSFPKRYAWTQCFFEDGSLMLSAAEIPLGPARFTGVIGVIHISGREYRLATYLGAKVVKCSGGELVIRQGSLRLTAALLEEEGCLLRAPENGAMTRLVRENVACRARYELTQNGRRLFVLEAARAAFEYEFDGAPPSHSAAEQ